MNNIYERRKKINRIIDFIALIIGLALFIFFSIGFFIIIFSLDSCYKGPDILESGNFIYYIMKNGDAVICGLTDEGREQQYLIIPQDIDGHKVTDISKGTYSTDTNIIKKYGETVSYMINSEKLRKIYITSNVSVSTSVGWGSENVFVYCPELVAVVVVANENVNYGRSNIEIYKNGRLCYVPVVVTKDMEEYNSNIANVTYYYNFDGAENGGYYWIDYCVYGEKIDYIPLNPEREGFEFGGWYKEAECINRWDFVKDRLPAPVYDAEENEIYQETALYAEWIEK